MPQSEKIKAIVLKRTKYGEADLVLHALTPQGGKVSGLARGALKSKKRFGGGVLEPTHYIELLIKPSSRADGLGTLEDAKMIESFDGLRTSYEKLEAALALIETTDRIAQSGDTSSHHLFDLLGNGLRVLQTTKSVSNVQAQFHLKILFHQGVLEPESWMAPYLRAPMSEADSLATLTAAQQKWILEQVEVYLATAERF